MSEDKAAESLAQMQAIDRQIERAEASLKQEGFRPSEDGVHWVTANSSMMAIIGAGDHNGRPSVYVEIFERGKRVFG